MTEMVSSPRRMRSSEKAMASSGDMISICRPSVSCSPRYVFTRPMRFASCARVSSSQKTAGVAEARARVTASFTQSRIATSLVWHARQMSPASTSCSMTVSPPLVTTRTRPAAGSSKVLSCEPYSSAFCAMRPTFGTEPMVAGSKAPFARQSSMTVW